MQSSLYQVIRGIVQFSIPSLGVVYVRPIEGAPFDQTLICSMQTSGGYFGSTIFNAPQTGQLVLVYKYTDTGKCCIVACANNNTQERSQLFNTANSIHNYPWTVVQSNSLLTKKCLGKIDNLTFGDLQTDANGVPCDIVAGDLYIGDKTGGGLFVGKSQLLLKSGQLCAIQLDAVHKKIVQTYLQRQAISLHSYQKESPNASIKLRAASVDQQFGRKSGTKTPIYSAKQAAQGTLQLTKVTDTASLFRQQSVSGSAYNGAIQLIVLPDNKQQVYTVGTSYPCVYLQSKSYTGDYKLRAQSICSVKSASIRAPQYTQNTKLQLAYKKPSINTVDIQTASIDAPLFLQDHFDESQVALSQQQARYMLQDGFYTFPTTLQDSLDWKDGQDQTQQYLAQPKHAQLYDAATEQTHTLYKNTSFIQQAPDGSIFIKDGWGSQIRMSRGNIILSSALDTFIRPGRDCIELVPRLKQITTNGPAVISAKGSIKLGAQKDVKIASALSGGQGSTVLQNRTRNLNSQNSGVVIRSNADMSITASRDMYIGLNDKTSQNAKDQVTPSPGTLMIDGGNVLTINCTQAIKFTAGQVQMFGHNGDRGSGIAVSPGRIAMVSPSIDVDSMLRIGQYANNAQIDYLGGTLSLVGASVYGIQLTGFIDCKQLVARQYITTLGNVIGGMYATVQDQPQQQIYKLRPQSIRTLRDNYGKDLKLQMSDVQNIQFVTVSCYADSFICDRQFHFLSSQQLGFSAYTMPGMCWQQNKQSSVRFQPIKQTATGQQTYTASYPGSKLWQDAVLTTVVDGQLNKDKLMKDTYFTSVKEQIKEN